MCLVVGVLVVVVVGCCDVDGGVVYLVDVVGVV